MSKTGKRLIKTVAVVIAATAIAVAAGAATAHPTPAAHHAIAEGGLIDSD